MTTFGNTTAGSSTSWMSTSNYRGNKYAAPISGNIAKFSAYGYEDKSDAVYAKGVLLNANDAENVFVVTNGITDQATIPAGSGALAWFDLTFATPPAVISGVNYILAIIISTSSSNFAMKYDSGQDRYYHTGDTIASPGDFGSTASYAVLDTAKQSIYATYVEASSAVKTVNGLAIASVKTRNGLAKASVKTWNGLA